MKRIAILGSTGSIGHSALAVVDAHPDRLSIVALAAGENAERLAAQIARYRPRLAAMASNDARERLKACAPGGVEIAPPGPEGLVAVASHPDADIVLCASSGTDALEAVLAAIERGKTIALANKEVLVMAGGIVIEAARAHRAAILPVDSEHNAIHQCLQGRSAAELKRLVLTASGGPFRGRGASELAGVTAADALKHPTWQMGRKITIDSATLMNKGLEVIEARWLFGFGADEIDVVVHPESVVHSMIELVDGSVIAQLGVTDMRHAIQYALTYPERHASAALPPLDLTKLGTLRFEPPDFERFPCLRLAYRALRTGGTLPAALNAANEEAVKSFLDRRIRLTDIPRIIEAVMDAHRTRAVSSLDVVLEVDREARAAAAAEIARLNEGSKAVA